MEKEFLQELAGKVADCWVGTVFGYEEWQWSEEVWHEVSEEASRQNIVIVQEGWDDDDLERFLPLEGRPTCPISPYGESNLVFAYHYQECENHNEGNYLEYEFFFYYVGKDARGYDIIKVDYVMHDSFFPEEKDEKKHRHSMPLITI